jgi:hypothetical protein
MKQKIAIVLALLTNTMCSQLPARVLAQEIDASGSNTLLPPRVDHVGVRATLLHWGMSTGDVERIMGAPGRSDLFANGGHVFRVLTYPAEPIGTTVTFTDNGLSGVALDIAGIDDPKLPNYSRPVWLGLSRATVLRLLGTPADDRLWDGFGMTIEQMTFERPSEPDVSVFFVDGRVVTKKIGKLFRNDILGFALPLAPDPGDSEIDQVAERPNEWRIRIGMKANEMEAHLGDPKLKTDYTFKGRPAVYAIYETSPGKSFGRFTFVDGVLTEFGDGGSTLLSQILDGR